MKNKLLTLVIVLLMTLSLTACSLKSEQEIISENLGINTAGISDLSVYDTHSGNGDGVSCVTLVFDDDRALEDIEKNSQWKKFPLDETANTLLYGVSDQTSQKGPFLTDEDGNNLVPYIENGYYVLIDRQAQEGLASGADILNRGSFNFTLAVYDIDAKTLYVCDLDT